MPGKSWNPVERVAGKYAFFPPAPPWYELVEGTAGDKALHSKWTERMAPSRARYKAVEIDTTKGEKLAAVYIPAPTKVKRTLLFSHGNAVDIGQLAEFFRELALEMQLNVLGYDYSGYGRSSGLPSVSNTLADISACYAWLLSQGCSSGDIMLYGQSVGSGPTIDLAARTKGLAGVVLHSPLLSGMQVLKPGWSWWPGMLDVYPNHALVSKIQAPVLIMHGLKDEVVGIEHGKTLHRRLQNPHPPLWAKRMGHQNLELDEQFMPTLAGFATACRSDKDPAQPGL